MGSSKVALLTLRRDEVGHMRAALQATTQTLYIFFTDAGHRAADEELLTLVAHLYDLTAMDKPRLNVVPLLGFSGWTPQKIAELEDLQTVLRPVTSSDELFKHLQASRPAGLPPLEPRVLEPVESGANLDSKAASNIEVVGGPSLAALSRVAVGGTFDRLHAGHRSLLSVAALIATSSVYVGVAGDKLLEKKKFKELLQSYDERADAVQGFLLSVRPQLEVVVGPLLDPKKRTAAAEDPGMKALVVSQETRSGGEAINEDRAQQGFGQLVLVIVNLLGSGSPALEGKPLSSTALRAQEREGVATG